MSLVEPRTATELTAHYKAVRMRLLTPTSQRCQPLTDTPPRSERLIEGVAARWRETDERLFGGRVSAKAVIAVTAAYFGVSSAMFCGPSRQKATTGARYAAVYVMSVLCRQLRYSDDGMSLVKLSTPQIGRHFSRDHTSIMHEFDAARHKMSNDSVYAVAITEIISHLRRHEN